MGIGFYTEYALARVAPTASTADYANTPLTNLGATAFLSCSNFFNKQIPMPFPRRAWLTTGNGVNGKWSIKGAEDAMKFVETGSDLQLSFEWNHLLTF